jgi:Predicted S-adenosylmethionine-dependent methyltransferase involved in cell envelope biogenesis
MRMAVNGELNELKKLSRQIPSWLKPGGRLVIISFHSLEDRIVKQAFRRQRGLHLPEKPAGVHLRSKAGIPAACQAPCNSRRRRAFRQSKAGSAKLRAAERL